jgi:hypothetical protein
VTESTDAYPDENNIWEYIKEYPNIIGIPVTENKSLNLLGAMAQIKEALSDEAITEAHIMLDMLATAIVSAVQGTGERIVEEIIVAEAMEDFDQQLKGIMDEEH